MRQAGIEKYDEFKPQISLLKTYILFALAINNCIFNRHQLPWDFTTNFLFPCDFFICNLLYR